MKPVYITNRDLVLTFEGATLNVPAGAECILIPDATYCDKLKRRVDAYALKAPEQYGNGSTHHYAWIPNDAIKGILAKAVLVREAIKQKSDDWQETADQWRVNIGGQYFDYYTGVGHRVPSMDYGAKARFKDLQGKNLTEHGFKSFLACSKPKPPLLDDVLHSLVMDSSACDESFDDWCSNLGYDMDSRKALETYLQCQENATKLRKAGVNINAERERLQDY